MLSKPLLAQTARRSRKRAHNAPPDPRSRIELVIPNDRRMHSVRNPMGGPNQDELFLQYDSGPNNDRILIFGRRSTMARLEAARKWYVHSSQKYALL